MVSPSPQSAVRWQRVGLFYGVSALGLSAAALALYALQATTSEPVGVVLTAGAMFSPLLAVLVVQRADGERLLHGIGVRPRLSRWLLVASAVPLALAGATLVIGPLLPGVRWDWAMEGMFARYGANLTPEQISAMRDQMDGLPVHPLVLAIPQAVIAGFTINGLLGFGEEVGWRGWLQRELAPLGFWRASLLTGVLWGLWHSPFVLQGHNYPNHPLAGVPMFTGMCVLLSPLLSWVRDRAGTVWAAAVFHGTFNAAAPAAIAVNHGSDLLAGVQGVAGLLVLVVLNLALFLRYPTGRRV